ncbi:NAD(P)-dependent dehydrogenase (short-subunit alcohol dehydrogenase family) [Brachybacterium muris]|uniref:SDR family NAD(P)-dependent oxidoreductase n=1 Tax=Brachybacterium muris TaxID=219301 RepID=UPI001957F685|nr:SDR family NAD(P)-dependent oxidoreductase [Brachybacterium muris]MBM7502325.1 NAD(P)-dependent dehydrogenase (short-subunit alcohol dehydrogenase family) [Brachybacterium muris]MCT1429691.1 SDR family oxidoreductase [Brachybacterium muris]
MSGGTEMAGRFHGRRVLVVGGAHGIGAACAARFARDGAQVAVADLDVEAARATVEKLEGSDAGQHVAVQMDMTDRSSVDAAVAEVVEHLGGLDVLANVAGGDDTGYPPFEDLDDETWARMLDWNLLGAVRTIRAALPHLRASDHGAVVSVSSVNALMAFGGPPYSAAKLGLLAVTKNLATEFAADGIRVNAVAPGTVRTRVWGEDGKDSEQMRHMYPLGRVGEPEDIAAAVAFLASDDASWITGHTLPVDGGVLLRGPGPGTLG